MIHFDCDYLEGCHPAILQRLENTNLEQTTGYGTDPHCEHAAELIRQACEAPEAEVHFLVGGTQTNATVLSALLRPHQGVLCAVTGHINAHETGAIEHGGHKVLPLPSPDGKITAEQVQSALDGHFNDVNHEHIVQPGAVYISFPTELGTLYSLQELEALSAVCRNWEIPFFIDGARLGYGLASSCCDVQLKDIARLADVFYIGGTKQGALFGEAVVFRSSAYSRDFRYLIKMNGGMLAKGRLLGIQFETLMENELYFKLARNADRLAEKLTAAFKAAGIELLIEGGTNQVFPILTEAQAAFLAENFGFEYWTRTPDGRDAWRFCTSWATTDRQVDTLTLQIKKL